MSEIEVEYCHRKSLYPEQIAAWWQAFLSEMGQKAELMVDREQARQDQKRIKQLGALNEVHGVLTAI
ncbi:hypothetical protein ACJA3S_18440 [Pseudomonas sp. KnCO4]|uniref:hypothetical protein n=1 Tax=Pseudomonas sp. KnCO4 TaxID=3381355 RepID=UPI003877961D